MLIQSKVTNDSTFTFNEATLSDKEKELRSLNRNKAYTFKSIPPKILKENRECCSDILQKPFNNFLSNKEFPGELKLANVTRVYKKMILLNLKTTDLQVNKLCMIKQVSILTVS